MSSLVTLEDKQKTINAATLQSLKLLWGKSKQRPVTFEGLRLLIYSSIRDARSVKNVSQWAPKVKSNHQRDLYYSAYEVKPVRGAYLR